MAQVSKRRPTKNHAKNPDGLISHQGSIEHHDELIFVVKDGHGEICDAEIDEFFKLERQSPTYLVLTLIGTDETDPYKIIIESDSKIRVRQYGVPLPLV